MTGTYIPPAAQDKELADFIAMIQNSHSLDESLVVIDGKKCEVPSAVAEVFTKLLKEVASGNPVSVVAHEQKMTTQQAADYLGMSRPTLINYLEKFQIPIETIGRHRRIKFSDVEGMRDLIRADRRAGITKLIRMTEELGLYDEIYQKAVALSTNEKS